MLHIKNTLSFIEIYYSQKRYDDRRVKFILTLTFLKTCRILKSQYNYIFKPIKFNKISCKKCPSSPHP